MDSSFLHFTSRHCESFARLRLRHKILAKKNMNAPINKAVNRLLEAFGVSVRDELLFCDSLNSTSLCVSWTYGQLNEHKKGRRGLDFLTFVIVKKNLLSGKEVLSVSIHVLLMTVLISIKTQNKNFFAAGVLSLCYLLTLMSTGPQKHILT